MLVSEVVLDVINEDDLEGLCSIYKKKSQTQGKLVALMQQVGWPLFVAAPPTGIYVEIEIDEIDKEDSAAFTQIPKLKSV